MNADITIALGFTEPECGSDVAAARTKAVRSGDEWIINGSKMFTTNGHIADYVFLLARTNPEKPKHKGLTMFLVPLDAHGVEVQAVWTLSGERTNITFYSDVRVGDECRIGEVDGGWGVLGDLTPRRACVRMGASSRTAIGPRRAVGVLRHRRAGLSARRSTATSAADSPGSRSRQRYRACCCGGASG